MTDAMAYLLEMRLRARGDAYATQLVDRCLSMVARASGPNLDRTTVEALEQELEALRDELALRFGAPKALHLH